MAILNIISDIKDKDKIKNKIFLVQNSLKIYKPICESLSSTSVYMFDDLYISYKSSSNLYARIQMVLNILKLKIRTNKIDIFCSTVEKLFVPSDDVVCRVVFNKLRNQNRNITISLYDDGVGTYNLHTFKGISFLGKITYRILLDNDYVECIKDIYCYQPELIEKSFLKLNYIRINCNDIIVKLFQSVIDSRINCYDGKKVIFLDQGLSDVKEVKESLNSISKIFSNDDVIIKLHPRIKSNIKQVFSSSNDGYPFELLLSLIDFSNTILVSHSSGGIINSLLMRGENKAIVVYLVKMTNKGISTPTIEFLERVQRKYGNDCLNMPNTIEELDTFLLKNKNVSGAKIIKTSILV